MSSQQIVRHLKLNHRYLAKKSVCYLMHNFYHGLRKCVHYLFLIMIQEHKVIRKKNNSANSNFCPRNSF